MAPDALFEAGEHLRLTDAVAGDAVEIQCGKSWQCTGKQRLVKLLICADHMNIETRELYHGRRYFTAKCHRCHWKSTVALPPRSRPRRE